MTQRLSAAPVLTGRDPKIDLLRAIAIVLVLVWHLQPLKGFRSPIVAAPVFVFNVQVALLAVPLLFTLSLLLLLRRGDASWRYLRRRTGWLAALFAVFSCIQWGLAALVNTDPVKVTAARVFMGGPPLDVGGDSVFYFLSDLMILTALGWLLLRVPRAVARYIAWATIALPAVAYPLLSVAGVELSYWDPLCFLPYVGLAWVAVEYERGLARAAWALLGAYVVVAAAELLFMEYGAAPFTAPIGGMQREVYARVTLILGVAAVLALATRLRIGPDAVVYATSRYSLGLYALHKWLLLAVVTALAGFSAGALSALFWLGVTVLTAAGTAVAVALLGRSPLWRLVRTGRSEPLSARVRRASARRWAVISTAVCAASVVGLTAYRQQYGVTIYDEAFYAALPYRATQGARAFVDEINLGQTFSLLTRPVVWLYQRMVGGSTGLVAVLRLVYLVAATALSGLTFMVLRRWTQPALAALASLACVAVVFFSIGAPSYNTIASGALTAAMVLGLRGLGGRRPTAWMVAAGVAQGVSVVAYPPLALVLPVAVAALATASASSRARRLLAFGLGAAVPLLALSVYLVSSGLGDVITAVGRSTGALGRTEGFGGTIEKLASQAVPLLLWPPVFPVLAGLVVLGARMRARWLPVVLGLAPVVCAAWAWRAAPYYRVLDFVILWALLAPLSALAVPPASSHVRHPGSPALPLRALLLWGVLPSCTAGLVCAYFSANGLPNAGIGLAPAALVTSLLVCMALSQQAPADRALAAGADPVLAGTYARRQTVWAPVALVSVLVVGVVLHYTVVFYDDPLPRLAHPMAAGPFRGLRTTTDRVLQLDALTADLERLRALSGERARAGDVQVAGVCFLSCPAGYLYPTLPANTNSVWQFPRLWDDPQAAGGLPAYYRAKGVWPLAVIEFRPVGTRGAQAGACVLGPRYEPFQVRPWYVVFVARADASTGSDGGPARRTSGALSSTASVVESGEPEREDRGTYERGDPRHR